MLKASTFTVRGISQVRMAHLKQDLFMSKGQGGGLYSEADG